MPTTTVIAAGNLRSAPRVAPDTSRGKVAGGDTVALLENTTINGQTWYRVRLVTTQSPTPAGSEGWVSGTLLAPLASPR
jgi:hypothetical protein